MLYIFSDLHFNHYSNDRGITTFERTNFSNIEEHDNFLIDVLEKLSKKLTPQDTVGNLGDFGSLSYLWTMNMLKDTGATINFILGNHDKQSDLPEFKKYFDNVYEYPIGLSNKLVLSHIPVAVYEDCINIHGHLHGSKLKDDNHINASIAVANYTPITDKHISTIFGKIPKYNRRFLFEPYAADYIFTQPKEDVIMDKNGRIDLSASRLLLKLHADDRRKQKEDYNPYTGGL